MLIVGVGAKVRPLKNLALMTYRPDRYLHFLQITCGNYGNVIIRVGDKLRGYVPRRQMRRHVGNGGTHIRGNSVAVYGNYCVIN